MNCKWKRAMASFLVLALTAIPCLSCGDENGGVKLTITIGEITDLTGPASPAIITLHYALEDMVRRYNEEEIIPGVKLKIVSWDTKYDAARQVPGYDWVRGKGAKLIISVTPDTGVYLKPFADRDEFPLFNLSTDVGMLEPPGWVFTMSTPISWGLVTLMDWVRENHWDDDQGTPKIGLVGWAENVIVSINADIEEYLEKHPGEWEYAGVRTAPFGTVAWSGEVDALKDCDYVCAYGFPAGAIINEFHERGHSPVFLDSMTGSAYRGFLMDLVGFPGLDGMLSANISLYRDQTTPMVEQAKEILDSYRPGEAEEIIDAGFSYIGGWHNLTAAFQILHQAIDAVGAENLSSQAIYDAAVNYKATGAIWEGYPEWSFSPTKRYLIDHVTIYEFQEAADDMVRITDYWIPLVK